MTTTPNTQPAGVDPLDIAVTALRFYADPKNNCPGATAREALDLIALARTSPVLPAAAGADALRKLCDQLDAMKRTMFLRPGTGQNYSYLVHEDVAAYIEEARSALAQPAALPTMVDSLPANPTPAAASGHCKHGMATCGLCGFPANPTGQAGPTVAAEPVDEVIERLPNSRYGSRCPMCGVDHPHTHTPREITIFRNGAKYAARQQEYARVDNQGATQDEANDAGRAGAGSGAGAHQHHEHRAGQSGADGRAGVEDGGSAGLSDRGEVREPVVAPASPTAAQVGAEPVAYMIRDKRESARYLLGGADWKPCSVEDYELRKEQTDIFEFRPLIDAAPSSPAIGTASIGDDPTFHELLGAFRSAPIKSTEDCANALIAHVDARPATALATQAADTDAKDGARYRWFKDNYLKYGNSDPDIRRPIVLFEGRWYGGHFDNINDLDAAIDAAMSASVSEADGSGKADAGGQS